LPPQVVRQLYELTDAVAALQPDAPRTSRLVLIGRRLDAARLCASLRDAGAGAFAAAG
jgi:hypothetical protein